MSDKTKQRIRARMARTGETYQAAWNAVHSSAGSSAFTAVTANDPTPKPLQWRCDICGAELVDAPRSGMVSWLYEPEPRPPFEYVGALFFCHKGACDEVVRGVAATFDVSDSWVDLITLMSDHWYDASQGLLSGKRWSALHEERLATFFRAVSSARERGWRPDLVMAKARPTHLTAIGDSLDERVRVCFAPESTILEREAIELPREDVEELSADPATTALLIEQMPTLKREFDGGESPERTSSTSLKNAKGSSA